MLQSCLQRTPLPASRVDPTKPNLSAASMREYELLSLSDKDWDHMSLFYGENGQPLLLVDEAGNMVINDPLLQQWDEEARQNAQEEDRR